MHRRIVGSFNCIRGDAAIFLDRNRIDLLINSDIWPFNRFEDLKVCVGVCVYALERMRTCAYTMALVAWLQRQVGRNLLERNFTEIMTLDDFLSLLITFVRFQSWYAIDGILKNPFRWYFIFVDSEVHLFVAKFTK